MGSVNGATRHWFWLLLSSRLSTTSRTPCPLPHRTAAHDALVVARGAAGQRRHELAALFDAQPPLSLLRQAAWRWLTEGPREAQRYAKL